MAYIEQNFIDGVTIVYAAWLNGLQDVLGAAAFYPKYDPTQTYNVGDLVSEKAKLYRCTTQITTPEEWTIGHWEETNIGEVIETIMDDNSISNADIDALFT